MIISDLLISDLLMVIHYYFDYTFAIFNEWACFQHSLHCDKVQQV